MPSINSTQSVSGGGVTMSSSVNRSPDSVSGLAPTLNKGKTGTLTTRTDNDTGIATMTAGHGLATSDHVDVYWNGGRRYNMTCTVATNAVTIDGGSGDNLPSTSTALVVTKRQLVNVAIDGDELSLAAFQLSFTTLTETSKGQVSLYDAGDALVAHLDLDANASQSYDVEGGSSNPFTGNPITYAYCTNGSSDNDATLKIIVGQDSTP